MNKKLITRKEIQELYPLVNSKRDWYVDEHSFEFVDKIIEKWFESKGYDFWDNPYPEVLEWKIIDKEILFIYQ